MKRRFKKSVYVYTYGGQTKGSLEKVKFLDEVAYLASQSAIPLKRQQVISLGVLFLKHLNQYWKSAIEDDIKTGWKVGADEVYKIIS